jgi:hypothetical protein
MGGFALTFFLRYLYGFSSSTINKPTQLYFFEKHSIYMFWTWALKIDISSNYNNNSLILSDYHQNAISNILNKANQKDIILLLIFYYYYYYIPESYKDYDSGRSIDDEQIQQMKKCWLQPKLPMFPPLSICLTSSPAKRRSKSSKNDLRLQ